MLDVADRATIRGEDRGGRRGRARGWLAGATEPNYTLAMEWAWVLGCVVAYFVVMKWVLPRFGIPT